MFQVSPLIVLLALLLLGKASFAATATGRVFLDENQNGRLDAQEVGIPKVRVSNGLDVVTTDKNGYMKSLLKMNLSSSSRSLVTTQLLSTHICFRSFTTFISPTDPHRACDMGESNPQGHCQTRSISR